MNYIKEVKKINFKHKNRVLFEYSKIDDYIYLGNSPCCKLHFRELIIKKGIRASISLQKEKMDHPIGADYFLWLPVVDKKAPSKRQLLIGAKTINNFVENRVKVYVHCRKGQGRGPTLVAAYFILRGLSVKDAFSRISKRRYILPTKVQIKALGEFAKHYRGKLK